MAAPQLTVRRQEVVLVPPSLPTPTQFLYLSNIDDQPSLRIHLPLVHFYEPNLEKMNEDPAKVVREALGKVLVHYYPLAGRLREAGGGKLVVDCTGEGVLFVEADANLSLADFGDIKPPIPGFDELLHDILSPQTVINSPLLLIQVTRLKCEGFIFAMLVNHCIVDGMGLKQFMTALGEIARGASEPSIFPIWERELLKPRLKPSINFPLYEYDQVPKKNMPTNEMVQTSFFFGPREIEFLKRQVHGQTSTFEVLAGYIWRLRTRAFNMPFEQEVRFMFLLDTRSKFEPPLPQGYYGNSIAFACAKTTVEMLANKPLAYAVELIKGAKTIVSNEYMRSMIDLMEVKGRPNITLLGSFMVSDLTKIKFQDVNFGWGKAIFGGPANSGTGLISSLIGFINSHQNRDGIKGKLLSINLPSKTIPNFQVELAQAMLHGPPPFTKSSL